MIFLQYFCLRPSESSDGMESRKEEVCLRKRAGSRASRTLNLTSAKCFRFRLSKRLSHLYQQHQILVPGRPTPASHSHLNQHRHYNELSHQNHRILLLTVYFKGHATGNFSAEILLHITWRIHLSDLRRKRGCLPSWPLELSRCFPFPSGVDFLSGRYLGSRHHNVSLLARSIILRLLNNKKHLKNVVQSGANMQERGGKDSNRIPRHTKKCAGRSVNITKNSEKTPEQIRRLSKRQKQSWTGTESSTRSHGPPANRPERIVNCTTGSLVSIKPKWSGRPTGQSLQQKESNMTVPRVIGHTIME